MPARVRHPRFDLAAIMRRAWRVWRALGGRLAFAECLRRSWRVAKVRNVGISHVLLADQYDAAQERGEVAAHGGGN